MTETIPAFELSFDQHCYPNVSVLFRFMGRVRSDLPHGVSVRSAARMTPQDVLPKGSVISATWQYLDGFEVFAEADDSALYVDVGNSGTFAHAAGATVEIAQEIGRGR